MTQLPAEIERQHDLDSWLRCLRAEFVAGDLTLEDFEDEVWHFLMIYEGDATMPALSPTLQRVLDEVVAVNQVLDRYHSPGVLAFHVRHFFGERSGCRDLTIASISRHLATLRRRELVERLPDHPMARYVPTKAGREHALPKDPPHA